jgi:cyclic pyranopterin phosphate synthase
MGRLPIVCGDSDSELPRDPDITDPIPLAARGTAGYPGWLSDVQGRRLRYLRFSITDRCDLKCTYCMPADGVPASARENVLSFEEIVTVAKVFRRIGVRTIRLTGGEPLVRKNIAELIRMLREEAGIEDLAMTTNATALEPLAKELVRAGLRRINVSVDSIDPDVFRTVTRGGDLQRVLRGIDAIQEAGIGECKTNTVVLRGVNDGASLARVVEWAWSKSITPRFIELMPLGEGAKLGRDAVVPIAEMQRSLAELLADEPPQHRLDRGPAGYRASKHDPRLTVGFIGAVTDNFCHRCNRVRITALGEIRACLASPSGISLRDLIRSGSTEDALVEAIEKALFGKRDGHEFYVEGVYRHHAVDMSRIGG